jgi:Fur family ferric uptake transcriptional regulator
MPARTQPVPCKHSRSACANTELIEEAVRRCKEAGLRRTRALEDVLHILIEAGRPLSLADVAESPKLGSAADRATVYRLLTKLEERGILRRVGLHDRSAYYTMVFPGQHNDYLICTRCGRIERLEIRCPVEALEKQIAKSSGFTGLYHELEFFGLCPCCA